MNKQEVLAALMAEPISVEYFNQNVFLQLEEERHKRMYVEAIQHPMWFDKIKLAVDMAEGYWRMDDREFMDAVYLVLKNSLAYNRDSDELHNAALEVWRKIHKLVPNTLYNCDRMGQLLWKPMPKKADIESYRVSCKVGGRTPWVGYDAELPLLSQPASVPPVAAGVEGNNDRSARFAARAARHKLNVCVVPDAQELGDSVQDVLPASRLNVDDDGEEEIEETKNEGEKNGASSEENTNMEPALVEANSRVSSMIVSQSLATQEESTAFISAPASVPSNETVDAAPGADDVPMRDMKSEAAGGVSPLAAADTAKLLAGSPAVVVTRLEAMSDVPELESKDVASDSGAVQRMAHLLAGQGSASSQEHSRGLLPPPALQQQPALPIAGIKFMGINIVPIYLTGLSEDEDEALFQGENNQKAKPASHRDDSESDAESMDIDSSTEEGEEKKTENKVNTRENKSKRIRNQNRKRIVPDSARNEEKGNESDGPSTMASSEKPGTDSLRHRKRSKRMFEANSEKGKKKVENGSKPYVSTRVDASNQNRENADNYWAVPLLSVQTQW